MKTVSMKGAVVDFSILMAKNEEQRALGNGSMNARGDIIGRGGAIVKRREQIASDYYANSPQAVRQVSLKDIAGEQMMTPAQAVKSLTPANPTDLSTRETKPTKRRMVETEE